MKPDQSPESCSKFLALAWEYYRMDFKNPLRSEINSHLSSCDDCRSMYERITAIDHQIAQQKTSTPSADLTNRILSKYRESRKETGKDRVIHLLTRPLAVAAGIALMITAGMFWGQWMAGKMMPVDKVFETTITGGITEEEAIIAEAGFITPGYNFLNE